jgi:hypothetical protein
VQTHGRKRSITIVLCPSEFASTAVSLRVQLSFLVFWSPSAPVHGRRLLFAVYNHTTRLVNRVQVSTVVLAGLSQRAQAQQRNVLMTRLVLYSVGTCCRLCTLHASLTRNSSKPAARWTSHMEQSNVSGNNFMHKHKTWHFVTWHFRAVVKLCCV